MNKYIIIYASLLIILISCAPASILTIEEYYERGRLFEEQGRIRQALRMYEDLLKFYPRSEFTKEVLFRSAELKYQRKNYIDALADYLIYQRYYMGIDESELINYRIASCYYHSRLAYNRDQTLLDKAILEYQNLIFSFPNSVYLTEAIERIQTLNYEKAKAELEVAVQYEKIRAYRAARKRLKYLIENYPGMGFEEESYFRLARIYYRIGDTENSVKYFEMLKEEYPGSRYVQRLRRRIG